MSAIPNVPATAIPSVKGVINGSAPPSTVPSKRDINGDAILPSSSSQSTFQLSAQPVENLRPVKVIVVGAGYSGIYCGIRIPERIRNVELVIYEKNAGIGGTWWENRYPGCACDIPSHSYQFSFEPNHDWSHLYAPAKEIREYLHQTAKKYGATRFIKLSHEVTACTWNSREGKWHVSILDHTSGSSFTDSSDILIQARGNLNNIAWPEISGLNAFNGELMHSAEWNESYDFKGKKVGVIGNGSSAIQIVPNLQKIEGVDLTTFVRGRTWISPPFGQELWEKLELQGYEIPKQMRERFKQDPKYYAKFRLAIEEGGNAIHGATIRNHPVQVDGQKLFEATMRERLAPRPDIYDQIKPSFAPGCRRLTPGQGYLEALTQPNVSFVKDIITRVEPAGVRTSDGTLHELDALVCATGFHVSTAPPFPITGLDGITLKQRWSTRPENYLSLAVDSFPNQFMLLGPNAAIGSGSLTMMIETTGDYIVKCIRKWQKDLIKSMTVKPARVRDFMEYADAYFKGTVFTDECRSWYRNKEGRITGLWPGSTLHCIEALRSPRWEDWEYVYQGDEEEGSDEGVVKKEGNRLRWLGNGWSVNQARERDLAWYLYPDFLEIPKEGRPEEHEQLRIREFSY